MNAHNSVTIRKLSLQANISWYFIGNVIYNGCQWGMLVVLAKIGTPEMIGIFSLALAITSPAMMFASSRMRLVQATDAREEYKFGDYLGLRAIFTILALLAILTITLIMGYSRETRLVIFAVALAKAFEMISDVFYGLLQKHERMDRIAKSLIIRGVVSLVALGFGVYLTGSIFWGTVGLCSSWAFVLIYYDIHSGYLVFSPHERTGNRNQRHQLNRTWRPRWEIRSLARLEWLILPLGFVSLLDSISVNTPRYFIDRYLGAAMLGIFSPLASFERVGTLIVQALTRSASARLSQYYVAKNSADFRTLLFKISGMALLLGVIGIFITVVFGEEIITFLYGPEYARKKVFCLLMVGAAFGYITKSLVHALTASRHIRIQLLLSPIIAIIMVTLCFFLIQSHGLVGGATAFMIARFIEMSVTVLFTGYMLVLLQKESTKQEKFRNPSESYGD